MRMIASLLLAFCLGLASVTAAVARSEMAGAVEMVICSGGAAMTVAMDATGRPVTAHHCPDCTAASVALPPILPVAGPRPVTRSEPLVQSSRVQGPSDARRGASARGPPSVV